MASRQRMSRRVRICKRCGEHPAKYSFRGKVKADDQHELCFQCFRAIQNKNRNHRNRNRRDDQLVVDDVGRGDATGSTWCHECCAFQRAPHAHPKAERIEQRGFRLINLDE